jgi:hypothetical protein
MEYLRVHQSIPIKFHLLLSLKFPKATINYSKHLNMIDIVIFHPFLNLDQEDFYNWISKFDPYIYLLTFTKQPSIQA